MTSVLQRKIGKMLGGQDGELETMKSSWNNHLLPLCYLLTVEMDGMELVPEELVGMAPVSLAEELC